jgi:hypothetical protein
MRKLEVTGFTEPAIVRSVEHLRSSRRAPSNRDSRRLKGALTNCPHPPFMNKKTRAPQGKFAFVHSPS